MSTRVHESQVFTVIAGSCFSFMYSLLLALSSLISPQCPPSLHCFPYHSYLSFSILFPACFCFDSAVRSMWWHVCSRRTHGRLARKLNQLQSKIIVGGVNLLEKAAEQQQLLEQSAHQLQLRRSKEEQLREALKQKQVGHRPVLTHLLHSL